MTTFSQFDLTQLNRQIAELEAKSARLEAERVKATKSTGRAKRRWRYLRLARRFRTPKASFPAWPIFVLAAGPLFTGALTLILFDLVLGTWAPMPVGFLIGAVGGAGLFSLLLYQPSDELLAPAIAEADAEQGMNQALLEDTAEQLAAVKEQLKTRLDERRVAIASGKLQRAALLQRNWKAMRGEEWKDFLVEVLRTHGARVDRVSGEVDLIAELEGKRVAILTEVDAQIANSDTIQQALAGKEQHHCHLCAVIINRRFTGAAQDFAKRKGCTAIGAEDFPDFVIGNVAL